jgi:Type III secretion system lipoprotein chaperone (YscW)
MMKSNQCCFKQVESDGAIVMTLKIIIVSDTPLPPGSSVKVEIRDTSLADAPAIVLHRVAADVPKTGRTTTVTVPIELTEVPDGTTVWAHVDADRDGRVSKGDYVSVESYPVRLVPVQNLTIRVKKVS